MRASCLMLTYNRMPNNKVMVEEAVQSFLMQDYEDKELIIVNDCPQQVLTCNAPGVVMVNLPRRAKSLGEKVNIAAALSSGDVLFRWDDDDICLPWRLSWSMERLGNAAYCKPSHFWFNPGNELNYQAGLFAACWFTRKAFDKVGGYPHKGVGEDQDFEAIMANLGLMIRQVSMDEAFYLYRWANGSIHVSGYGDTGYDKVGALPVKSAGLWDLQPHWSKDYQTLAKQAARNGGNYRWPAS